MQDRNKNKKGSQTDFIRYQDDKMNSEERNAFERELQKDHFTEEALEGFAMISAEKAGNDMTDLKRRLQERTGKDSLYLFRRIAAAAAIAAIVIVSSVIMITRHETQQVSLSQNINRKTTAPVSVPVPEQGEISPAIKSDRRPAISTPSPANTSEEKEKKYLTEEKIAEFQDAELKDSEITIPDHAIIEGREVAGSGPPKGKMMETSGAASMALKVESEKARYYIPPQPVSGRDSFNLYLYKNIINPEPDNPVQQVVTLSFLVYSDSTISEIIIKSSPGEAYSREAIRLIKQGPAWKPAMEDNNVVADSVSVNIFFR